MLPIRALEQVDPQIAALVRDEARRQYDVLRLIPSENYASQAVLEATGSVLTNKYSEGYPGKRYYQGQEVIDQIERLAIERAMELFGAEHANVQPYSGSPANLAAYLAVMEPGDVLMGMSLPHGGHLTHGWKVSATGRLFRAVQYTVDPTTHLIDYDAVRKLALEHRPRVIVCGATAYPRIIDFEAFASIAEEVGAVLVADISHIAGLVAGGAHPSPVPHAPIVTATTHKTLRGPRGALILCRQSLARTVDRSVFPGLQGGPHNHVTAAIAVALREASAPTFRRYAHQVVDNARALAERLAEHGFRLITGGTDNHLVLVDTTSMGWPGKVVARALERAGIVVNANTIPFDPRKPFDPSGIRLGTPAVTSRGMGVGEMRRVADWIAEVVEHIEDDAALTRIAGEVADLCAAFPPPGIAVRPA